MCHLNDDEAELYAAAMAREHSPRPAKRASALKYQYIFAQFGYCDVTMTATDDWITFADSHMLPNESIEACEGWPKGNQPHSAFRPTVTVSLQAQWALQKLKNSKRWA